MSRLRFLVLISILAAVSAALVACGDDDDGGDGADTGEDPQKVLDSTTLEGVESGVFDVSMEVQGGESGNFTATLGGPFQSRGPEEVPEFDVSVEVSGEGNGQSIDFQGGLISTGEAAFVNYGDTDYEVPAQTFSSFRALFEASAAQQQNQQAQGNELLNQLGIDPKQWLTNLENAGTEDVEGTDTVKITGDIDVDKFVQDAQKIAEQAGSLGQLTPTTPVPDPAQLDQLKSAVTDASFEVNTGVEDDLLRRASFILGIENPVDPSQTVDIVFDLTLSELGEEQEVEAPSDAQPLSELLDELGIGGLPLGGGLPGLPGAGSGLPGATAPPTGGAGGAQQEFLNCVAKAKTSADLEKCNALLGQ